MRRTGRRKIRVRTKRNIRNTRTKKKTDATTVPQPNRFWKCFADMGL